MQHVFILLALRQDQHPQPALGAVQSGAQCAAKRTRRTAAFDDVFFEAVPDSATALGVQFSAAGMQRAFDHGPGPVAIQCSVRGRLSICDINVLSIFIAQRETNRPTAAALAGAVLPALDEVSAQASKEKGGLFAMIDDGRRALVLALGHEFGKQFLHGVLGIVILTATSPGKRAKHRPVAAVKLGGFAEG